MTFKAPKFKHRSQGPKSSGANNFQNKKIKSKIKFTDENKCRELKISIKDLIKKV